MAGYGLRIKNPITGSIQIDGSYYNLALISKDVVTTATGFDPNHPSTPIAIKTYSGSAMPFIAITCSNYATIIRVDKSGNNWTFYFASESAGNTITIYRFDQPQDQGEGWGVRVKKNGQIIYDSRNRYLRVPNVLSGGDYISSPPSLIIPNGKIYAVAQGKISARTTATVYPIDGNTYEQIINVKALFAKTSSGQIASQERTLWDESTIVGPGPAPPTWQYTYQSYEWLILDVTGY